MDVKLFGLTVDATGALSTIKGVTAAGVQMAQDGAKSAQLYADAFQERLNRVARQYIPETIRAIESLKSQQRTLAAMPGGAGLLSQAEVQRGVEGYDRLINAQKGIETSSGAAFSGLGRIRMGLTSLVAKMTGTLPVVDRLAATLGGFAVGNAAMIAILAGTAALAFAYEKITEKARAAEKQAALTMKEFDRIAHMDVRGQGEAAGLLYSGDANATDPLARLRLVELQRQQAELRRRANVVLTYGGEGGGGAYVSKDARNADEVLQRVTAEITRRQTLLASITTNSLPRAGAQQARDDKPGFDTDVIKAREAADKEAERRRKQAAETAAREEERIKKMLAGADAEAAAAARVLSAYQRSEAAGKAQEREEAILLALTQSEMEKGSARYQQMERAIRQTFTATDATNALAKARKDESDAAEAAAKKQAADLLALQRRAIRETEQLVKSPITALITELANGKNAFLSFFDAIKQGFIRLLADIAAARLTSRLVGVVGGLLVPGLAGAQAAANGSPLGDPAKDAALALGTPQFSRNQMIGAGVGTGLAGVTVGYGIGQSASSGTMGAVGGALGGAATGAMIGMVGGPFGVAVGAAIGGLAGLAGGILGFSSASKEAARLQAEAQKQVSLTLASLRADVNRDTLGGQIAAENAKRESLRKQIEDAFPGGGSGSDQVRRRNAALAEMNALEDRRIQQIREEYALGQRRFAEDLQVRLLVAQNRTREADALRLQLAQQREMQEAIRNKTDPATLALLAQVQAQEKLYAATRATSGALNTVSGYKIQEQIFNAMSGRSPAGPFTGMPSSGAPGASGDMTVNVMLPDGSVLGKVVLKDFKRRAQTQYGDSTKWGQVQ